MRRFNPHTFLCLLVVILLTACHKTEGYHMFKPTNVDGWAAHDTVVFDIPANDTTLDYDLDLEARITDDYEFRDLWVVVEQEYTTEDENKLDSVKLKACLDELNKTAPKNNQEQSDFRVTENPGVGINQITEDAEDEENMDTDSLDNDDEEFVEDKDEKADRPNQLPGKVTSSASQKASTASAKDNAKKKKKTSEETTAKKSSAKKTDKADAPKKKATTKDSSKKKTTKKDADKKTSSKTSKSKSNKVGTKASKNKKDSKTNAKATKKSSKKSSVKTDKKTNKKSSKSNKSTAKKSTKKKVKIKTKLYAPPQKDNKKADRSKASTKSKAAETKSKTTTKKSQSAKTSKASKSSKNKPTAQPRKSSKNTKTDKSSKSGKDAAKRNTKKSANTNKTAVKRSKYEAQSKLSEKEIIAELDSFDRDKSIYQIHRDTVHLTLVNAEGDFTGVGRSLKEYSIPVRYLRLHKGEHGTIRIYHIMGKQKIKGVHDIGIHLEVADHSKRTAMWMRPTRLPWL